MSYQSLIPKVAAAFGLEYAAVGTAQKGYRNESYRLTLASGEVVNLIFHKNEREARARMQSASQAAAILQQAHFPVRTRFDDRILKLSDSEKEVYAGMYTYLPGKTIPWEAYTKNHIKLLGWAMSDMHAAWRSSGATLPSRVIDELQGLHGRMEYYFSSTDVMHALDSKLQITLTPGNSYKQLFEKLETIPISEEHILHMDLVRGNALFDTSSSESIWMIDDVSLAGIIDFEKATMGHPIYDIARTLAFLLVDCASKDRHAIYKYFLQSGYNKRGGSTFQRNAMIVGVPAYRALNMLIGFFLLHDFYKFLRHTPYESLPANHHFIRTRDILVDYGMIRYHKD